MPWKTAPEDNTAKLPSKHSHSSNAAKLEAEKVKHSY